MARRASGAAGQPRDLVRMRQRLDESRGSHARGVAWSAAVWAAAGRVARRHGVYVTARALGLEYNKLKGMSGVIGRVPGKAKRPSKDRKSTRLNSSHLGISYAVFCLKKKS